FYLFTFPLSLHDALPILQAFAFFEIFSLPAHFSPVFDKFLLHFAAPCHGGRGSLSSGREYPPAPGKNSAPRPAWAGVTLPPEKRSEEHTSELQSRFDLVC